MVLPNRMGPANLVLLVIATAAPFLLMAQPLSYSIAKPLTSWINQPPSNPTYMQLNQPPSNPPYKQLRAIVSSVQQEAKLYSKFAFAAGFVCASTACDVSLFAAFIVYLDGFGMVYQDPVQVVWSANRNRPVRENATLEFTTDGNLVLHDADSSHVWSSNSSGRSVTGMLITDAGNLVLFDNKNATVWQSFDHPTDTWVLGQSLLEGMRLTASTSATNTTENELYITIRKDGVYAYAGSAPPQLYYWSEWVPNGKGPMNITFMNGSLSSFVHPNIYFPLQAAESTIQYLRLDPDGHLRLYGKWSTVVYDVMPLGYCDYPTVCGQYGICTERQCACPVEDNSGSSYFKPIDDRKLKLGCTPMIPISCEEIQHHQLYTLTGISYFDNNSMAMSAINEDDCKQACLNDCSCRAVMFSYGVCRWMTKVFSFHSPTIYGYNSSIAYLKVQVRPSNSNPKKRPSNSNQKKIILGSTLGAIATLVLLVILVALYCLQRKRKYEYKDDEIDFDQLPGMPTRFSLEQLHECTEGFGKKLGEGGFGSVFEGKLGEERVAVKRLEGARQGKKEFLAEVETIGSIEHINLVKLIGFCAEKSERLLVYEYMSSGSLDRWIYYRHNNNPLDWCTRCRIILDIAKGLCYLHEECRRKIAHLDIKPQNILLDENFNAKVGDFGLCKLINRDQSKVVTVMRGTPGYLAPEWLTSRITEKVDVYSFGVVVMEIVSGRKNIDNFQPEEDVQLISLLREKAQNNQFMDLIDKHGDDLVSRQEEVIQMMKLAIWCLQNDSSRRPSMSTVIKVLEGAVSVETFDADSIMFVQDNPSTYSRPSQASLLSGPR